MLFQRSSDGKPKALPNTLDDCKGPRELVSYLNKAVDLEIINTRTTALAIVEYCFTSLSNSIFSLLPTNYAVFAGP